VARLLRDAIAGALDGDPADLDWIYGRGAPLISCAEVCAYLHLDEDFVRAEFERLRDRIRRGAGRRPRRTDRPYLPRPSTPRSGR